MKMRTLTMVELKRLFDVHITLKEFVTEKVSENLRDSVYCSDWNRPYFLGPCHKLIFTSRSIFS